MSDRWIITHHDYTQHTSLEAAQAERDRLSKVAPQRTFVVRRIKTGLEKSADKAELGAEIQRLRKRVAELEWACRENNGVEGCP